MPENLQMLANGERERSLNACISLTISKFSFHFERIIGRERDRKRKRKRLRKIGSRFKLSNVPAIKTSARILPPYFLQLFFFVNSRIPWLVRVIECENISGIWKGVKVEKWLQKLSSSSMDCKRIAGKGISSRSFNEVARLNEGKQNYFPLFRLFFIAFENFTKIFSDLKIPNLRTFQIFVNLTIF